jgi:O-acetylhomoserine (thiol)-lyase
LLIHPASPRTVSLTPEAQAASAVTAGLVRLNAGVDSIDDIIADLDRAFAVASS